MTKMTLKLRLQEDMKSAMRAQDKQRLNAIRLILAAVKQREVDERIEADDVIVFNILDKMLKQRRDSIGHFEAAGRHELADKEKFEINVIQEYLPSPLSEAEIDRLIEEAVVAAGASSTQDMGKVMSHIKPHIQGRADASTVSARIKARLAGN